MKLISLDEFIQRTLGGRPNQMNTSAYVGQRFDCACGVWHPFDPSLVDVLRELPKMQLVLKCPRTASVTCVRVKGILRFKGFEALFGVHAEDDAGLSKPAAGKGTEVITAELSRFLYDLIQRADQLACRLWTSELGLNSPIQERHCLGTIVSSVATSTKEAFRSDDCIDVASRFLADAKFDRFIQEADVREGLRELAREARNAARSRDVKQLSELVQTFLVAPAGGPRHLSPAESRSVVRCAASICADTLSASLLAP